MVRGRGTNRGRGARGRGARAGGTPAQRGEDCLCSTCGDDVGPDPIGCDDCDQWMHGTEMCTGLPQDLITAILKHNVAGISFSCMKCRVGEVSTRGNSPSGRTDAHLAETVNQLFTQVKGMCSIIKELTSQVKALSSKPPQSEAPNHDAAPVPVPAHPAAPPPLPPQDFRTLVREEVKEQKEREKRRDFLVVRGLPASSTSDFGTKFAQLTGDLMGTRVEVSEVMAIPGQSNYFRVKVMDENIRKQLLDKAKHLKGSIHQNVYVSRDLTYAQRTELYRRRQERRAQQTQAEGANRGGSGPTDQTSPAVAETPPVAGVPAAQADNPPQAPQAAPATADAVPGAAGSGN